MSLYASLDGLSARGIRNLLYVSGVLEECDDLSGLSAKAIKDLLYVGGVAATVKPAPPDHCACPVGCMDLP